MTAQIIQFPPRRPSATYHPNYPSDVWQKVLRDEGGDFERAELMLRMVAEISRKLGIRTRLDRREP